MRPLLLALIAGSVFAQTSPVYAPPTQLDRLQWAAYSTAGPPNLLGGVFTSAISTATNHPKEYGPHWEGYFKRQGLRLTGAATSNLMEAELGALWGEDPRYRRAPGQPVRTRVWHSVKTAFVAYRRDGTEMPAYARFIAVPATAAISNAWRPDSQRTAGETGSRIALGFLSRVTANTFAEFWPDIQAKLRR